jgi:hypothetical protein
MRPLGIYLDVNASMPIAPEAAAAIEPFLSRHYGNPSSRSWAAESACERPSSGLERRWRPSSNAGRTTQVKPAVAPLRVAFALFEIVPAPERISVSRGADLRGLRLQRKGHP